MKFDIEKFKRGEFVVNCRTEIDAINFLKMCHEHGMKWISGASLLRKTLWRLHKEKMCYEYDVLSLRIVRTHTDATRKKIVIYSLAPDIDKNELQSLLLGE